MNQEKIGKFIAENRKIKKLTQSELARKIVAIILIIICILSILLK